MPTFMTPFMMDSKIICFVATQNPASALQFYSKILGLKLISDDPFAIVFDANGTMLRVQKVQKLDPQKHTVLGWEVPDIRAKVIELGVRGVRFERYEGLDQDESGIWKTPSGAKVAWFKDPDGNTLSLTEFNQNVSSD
jgi:catechol 2,3-dioxygenase-like lactoylglutathione lyase family enzyme